MQTKTESGIMQSVFVLANWQERGFSHCEDFFTVNVLSEVILSM